MPFLLPGVVRRSHAAALLLPPPPPLLFAFFYRFMAHVCDLYRGGSKILKILT